jgi:hypothetical protein
MWTKSYSDECQTTLVYPQAEQPVLPISLLWADPTALRCLVMHAGTWSAAAAADT